MSAVVAGHQIVRREEAVPEPPRSCLFRCNAVVERLDPEAIRRTNDVASSAMSLGSQLSPALVNPNFYLDAACEFFSTINALQYVSWWIGGKQLTWQHTVSAIFFTAIMVRSVVRFLGFCHAYNLNELAQIGGGIPLGFGALNVVRLPAYAFRTWHYGRVIRDLGVRSQENATQLEKIERQRKKLKDLVAIHEQFAPRSMSFRDNDRMEVPERYLNPILEQDGDLKEEMAQLPREEGALQGKKWTHLQVVLDRKAEHCKKEIARAAIERRQNIAELINDINQVALSVFAIIGVCGVSFFAATGMPLLVLGIYVSTFSLAKYGYIMYQNRQLAAVNASVE